MVIQEINPEFIPGAKIKILGIGGCVMEHSYAVLI